MYRRSTLAILFALTFLIGCANISGTAATKHKSKSSHKAAVHQLRLSKYNGGFFTIDRPAGWKVKTAGKGSTLAFLVRDPSSKMRQVFCFTSIGPFYTNAYQKNSEINYVRSGGYPINWLDMPIVSPLKASTFFESFNAIANTKIAHAFMPDMPQLKNFKIISSKPVKSSGNGLSVQLIRAAFVENGKVGQGLFTAAVGEVQPYGWAFMVTGVSAPFNEFSGMEPSLLKTLRSFNLSKAYVQKCLNDQNDNFRQLLKAGKTMDEASDIIMDGWTERNKSEDILAEKRSDAILGKDRYYDPSTGDVYEYDLGHRPKPGLKQLPEHDYELWTKPTIDGERH